MQKTITVAVQKQHMVPKIRKLIFRTKKYLVRWESLPTPSFGVRALCRIECVRLKRAWSPSRRTTPKSWPTLGIL